MKTFKDGGPAFPVTTDHGSVYPISGMTLRDYFAAKAMQGFTANPALDCWTCEDTARISYEHAGAMLAQRAKIKEDQS